MNSTSRFSAAVFAAVLISWPVVCVAEGAGQRRVDEVRFEPPKLLKKAEIRQLLAREVPGPWDEAALKETEANVLRTGRFATVAPRFSEEGGRVVVTVSLVPRPFVRKVEVAGVTQLPRQELLRRLDLKAWRPLTDEMVKSVPPQVEEAYIRAGLPKPRVSAEPLEPGPDGATIVRISVAEIRLPKLASLSVESSGVPLLTWMTMEGKFLVYRWSAKVARFNRAKLEKVAKKEQKRLREIGFKQAAFLITEEPAGPEGEDRAVKVTLDLGPRERLEGDGVGRAVMNEVSEAWKRRNVPLTDGVVNRLARSAAEGMKERGYLDAAVKPKTVAEEKRKTVILEATPGQRSFVSAVRFEGNESFTGKELSKVVFVSPPQLLGLSKSRPGPLALADSEAALVTHYARHGFPQAKITSRLEGTEKEREVVFTIEEGDRQVIGTLAFPGATVISEAALRKLTKLAEGKPYWPGEAEEAAAAVRKAYAALGYVSATVTPKAEGGEKGGVALAFEVLEGTRFLLTRSIVRNNFKTGAGRILSEGDEKRGNPIDPAKVADHQTRLSASGLFDSATVRTEDVPGADPPQKIAVIEVAERPTAFVEYGLDINTQRGIEVAGTLGERNLFGRGLLGSVSVLAGTERQNIGLEMARPLRILGKRLFGTIKTSYTRDETYEGYTLLEVSGELGLTWELDTKRRVTLIYTIERQKPIDIEPDVAEELAPLTVQIGSITPSISLDHRDDPFQTRTGTYLMVRDKVSRRVLGGDTDYDRWEFDGRSFKTLSDMWTVAAAVRLGYASTHSGSDLPVGERFYIGGANTHRGFEEKQLGPSGSDGSPLGGESYVLGNVEVRFPLFGPIAGGVFLDVGNAYSPAKIELGDLRWAAGAGLRLGTPVGPLRFDVGYKLDKEAGESSAVWHISLGHAF
ncbi:MAG: Outer membrane protein assembly factor BamA [Thermoanaerobaculia bacterium]|nr:Outer membrane protein assembly factor BamA [Thermoanaerobaculia bacterium]